MEIFFRLFLVIHVKDGGGLGFDTLRPAAKDGVDVFSNCILQYSLHGVAPLSSGLRFPCGRQIT